jgi:hypothetical protein
MKTNKNMVRMMENELKVVKKDGDYFLQVSQNTKGEIKCPYCGKTHKHSIGCGHRLSHCSTKDRENAKVVKIGNREFGYNDGYYICCEENQDLKTISNTMNQNIRSISNEVELYDMAIFEVKYLHLPDDFGYMIVRIPTGWLYSLMSFIDDHAKQPVCLNTSFVPFKKREIKPPYYKKLN